MSALIQCLSNLHNNLFFRRLPGGDRHIPRLQTWRRLYHQSRVNLRQFANRRWRQIVAIFSLVPMELFHPRLQALPLPIRQIGVEDCGLVGKTIPVIGHDAAIPQMCL